MTDASRAPRARPLSPHLQVWRWHITMWTSILHRASGVALYGGALILAFWAISLAAGPEAYDLYMSLLGSPLGKLIMFGLTLSVFYHLGNGIRHLVWDAGKGLDVKTANATAVGSFAFAIAATLATWAIAFMTGAL
jgi:succinate dehydrogenase / fumarate reductase cytochrome b subunit